MGTILAAIWKLTGWHFVFGAIMAAIVINMTVIPFAVLPLKANLAASRKATDAYQKAALAWEDHARGWEGSARLGEARRKLERQTAVAAIAADRRSCEARVAAARKSAVAIERIVTKEPAYDTRRCPVREPVPLGSLRDALAPEPPR
jgi:hypothetical protein